MAGSCCARLGGCVVKNGGEEFPAKTIYSRPSRRVYRVVDECVLWTSTHTHARFVVTSIRRWRVGVWIGVG
jgi:hypothetical protein